MNVRAKFRCEVKTENPAGFEVRLTPVVGGSLENEQFYRYTPCGQIELSTINAVAAAAFKVGAEYYVDFTPTQEVRDGS